jgi:hypothetical protein
VFAIGWTDRQLVRSTVDAASSTDELARFRQHFDYKLALPGLSTLPVKLLAGLFQRADHRLAA